MPAFAFIGSLVATSAVGISLAATLGISAAFLGSIAAFGAAYITSRIINGNANKGNNSASNQGGRIQVPPATNNKIPVLYGSAYVNGIITDARLKSIGGTTNDTMYYCLVLSEYTNNLISGSPSYGLESVLWNDLRLTAVDATTNAHKVKDGRKVVDGAIIAPGSFVVGKTYIITKIGNTNFTLIGAQTNNIGQIFTATGAGTAGQTGRAQEEDFIDTNFIVDNNSLVELRVYAGGSSAAEQIYPPQTSSNTTPAYTFWGNNDGSWDNTYAMDGLVFAIVKLTYNGDKGFTALPNVTFQIANNVANPADVWYDYMTSKRYGAGIPAADIDLTARTAWYNFCEEDINYTNVAGESNQSTLRYNINGVIDTSNQVKTNIDTILQNGGAWMSYNVATGLWSPVIKKAVSAGTATDSATLFTASRSGTTLTVTNFPSGRIEAGQRLYNSTGTYIGTIDAQLAPTAGETAGQVGRYTTSSSGVISSTTFYTLPATSLEFSDDNIISGITISSTRLEDLYNKVEAEFYNRYNKDQRAYARNDLDSADRNPNEPDNQLRMSLDLVNNSMQADILGQLEMRQSRDDLVIEFTATHYGIQAQAGDIIAVTSELYDWAPKYFRVMRVKEIENEDASLTAQIQALEYNPDVYTIEPITEFSTSANIKIGNLISSRGLPKPETPVVSDENPNDSVPNFTFSINVPTTGGPFDETEIYVAEGWDPNSVTGKIIPGQVTVTNASGTGSVATLIFTAPSPSFTMYDIGQVVTIAGMTPSGYNGVKTITAVSPNSISYASTATGFTTGGTITNVVGAGKGLMTVTAVTYNSINVGDYFDLGGVTVEAQLTQTTISTKTFASGGAVGAKTFTLNNVTGVVIGQKPTGTGIPTGAMVVGVSGTTVTLDSAFTVQAAGSYLFTTAGGTGTYRVSISTEANGTDDLFDQPIDSDFRYLKKIVPDGNAAAFTSGSTISTIITELPANSQTFRRYFLKARLGVKKNFGDFSPNTPVDLDGNSIPWQPNPVGGGGGGTGAGVFTSVDINNTTPWLTFSTQPDGVNPKHGVRGKSTVDDYWFVGGGSAGDDLGYLELATADNSGAGESNSGGEIYVRQYNGAGVGGPEWVGGPGTAQRTLTLLDNLGNTIIPQNLTVDSGTLFVDATNNRVGINGITPSYELQITSSEAGPNDNVQLAMSNSERTFILSNNAADDLLSFNYAGANRLQFDTTNQWFNSGRLGINTDTPDYTLDVNGEAYINSTLTVHGSTYLGNNYITDVTNVVGDFKVTNNSVDNLFVDHTTGYVGINDATPSYNLDVNGTANVETTLTVPSITTLTGDDLNITAFTGKDINITATGTGSPLLGGLTLAVQTAADPVTIVRNTNNATAANRTLTLRANSNNTPVVGFGNQLEFETESTPNTFVTSGYIETLSTAATAGVLDTFKMNFGLLNAGSSAAKMELDSLGNLQIDGDITVSGGDITLNGSTSGSVKLSAGATPAVQTYTLPSAYPATNNYGLRSTTGGTLSWALTGDVSGPASATDNAVARFDLTTGKLIQDSNVIIDDLGNITTPAQSITINNDSTAADSYVYFKGSTEYIKWNESLSQFEFSDAVQFTDIDASNSSWIHKTLYVGDITLGTPTGVITQYGNNVTASYDAATIDTQVIVYQYGGTTIETINEWDITAYRSAKYLIQIDRLGESQLAEVFITHDGTNVSSTISPNINTGSALTTLSVDISGGKARLRSTNAALGATYFTMERKLITLVVRA